MSRILPNFPGNAVPLVSTPKKRRVIWAPLKGRNGLPSSQQLALSCKCNEILFEGTRGGGKTDTQLMSFKSRVGMGYGRFWRGILFDRKYKNLDDIISKSLRWFPQFNDGAKFVQGGGLKWEWPDGEALLFRHMMRLADYHNYHGHEYPWIGWNELTKQPTSELYDMMRSCCRTSFLPHVHSPDLNNPLPEIPLQIFNTTNPHGPGHVWVKKHWKIGVIPPGVVQRLTARVFNPRTQREEEVVRTMIRLFSSYKENVNLPPEYIMELDSIKDPNKRKAWLEGDWDIDVGGALEGVWEPRCQVVPRFKVPAAWRIQRSFDWGSTHPFSVGWWARSNGEEVEVGDRIIRLPAGSLVRCAEWYGCEGGFDGIGSNRGLKLSARKVAQGVKAREERLMATGWFKRQPQAGPADGQIYAVNEKESSSIASKMQEEGIEWYPADKRAGSRKNGLQLVRDGLENSMTGEGPGIYFMDNCHAALATLPNLPRDEDDPDDVDTTAEDHLYDEMRYMVLDNAPDFERDLSFIKM